MRTDIGFLGVSPYVNISETRHFVKTKNLTICTRAFCIPYLDSIPILYVILWDYFSGRSTLLRSFPIPSISTSTTSPSRIGAIPFGVPVATMSPGQRVMHVER